MANLAKAASKAYRDPLGAAKDVLGDIGSALGIGGPSTADLRNRSYVDVHKKIRAGDYDGLAHAVRNSKWLGARWEAAWALVNRSRDANAAEAARRAAGVPRDAHPSSDLSLTSDLVSSIPSKSIWESSTSPAPNAEPSTPSGGTTERPPRPSVPAAPKRKSGTKRSPGSEPAGFLGPAVPKAPKAKRPCKYGPRDADGYCPKKPSTYVTRGRSTRNTKAQTAALRKAEQVAMKVVSGGLKGAGAAISAAAAALGTTPALLAGAVAAAAAAGWLIGQGVNKVLTGVTREEALVKAATDRIHARAALAKVLGRDPSLAEQKAITTAYEKAVWTIQNHQLRPPTDAELEAWRSQSRKQRGLA